MFNIFFILSVDFVLILTALFQIYTKGTLYRQIKGGDYVKIWWNRQFQNGYHTWEKDVSKNWDALNGKVVDEEKNEPASIVWWMCLIFILFICHMKAFQLI